MVFHVIISFAGLFGHMYAHACVLLYMCVRIVSVCIHVVSYRLLLYACMYSVGVYSCCSTDTLDVTLDVFRLCVRRFPPSCSTDDFQQVYSHFSKYEECQAGGKPVCLT